MLIFVRCGGVVCPSLGRLSVFSRFAHVCSSLRRFLFGLCFIKIRNEMILCNLLTACCGRFRCEVRRPPRVQMQEARNAVLSPSVLRRYKAGLFVNTLTACGNRTDSS